MMTSTAVGGGIAVVGDVISGNQSNSNDNKKQQQYDNN